MGHNLLPQKCDWKSVKLKNVIDNLNLNTSNANTDRPIVFWPETKNDFRANKTTFRSKINSSNSYPQSQENKLQNSKKC